MSRWARAFDHCVRCNRDDSPHVGKGVCRRCTNTRLKQKAAALQKSARHDKLPMAELRKGDFVSNRPSQDVSQWFVWEAGQEEVVLRSYRCVDDPQTRHVPFQDFIAGYRIVTANPTGTRTGVLARCLPSEVGK